MNQNEIFVEKCCLNTTMVINVKATSLRVLGLIYTLGRETDQWKNSMP